MNHNKPTLDKAALALDLEGRIAEDALQEAASRSAEPLIEGGAEVPVAYPAPREQRT